MTPARMARTRPRLPAAARGYGSPHRTARAAAIAAWQPGQPCARCGQPIACLWMRTRAGAVVSAVDLGHRDGTGKTQYAGLEHRYCSRSAGAALGNRQRGQRRAWRTQAPWQPPRRW